MNKFDAAVDAAKKQNIDAIIVGTWHDHQKAVHVYSGDVLGTFQLSDLQDYISVRQPKVKFICFRCDRQNLSTGGRCDG